MTEGKTAAATVDINHESLQSHTESREQQSSERSSERSREAERERVVRIAEFEFELEREQATTN